MEWLISLGNAFQNPATYIDALTLGSIYALIAVGYTMVYGIIKLINFAHGEIIMLGTYIAFLVVTGLNVPIVVAMLIAMLACAAVGATIDWTAYLPLRRSLPKAETLSLIGLFCGAGLLIAFFTTGEGGEAMAKTHRVVIVLLVVLVVGLLGSALADLFGWFGTARNNVESDRLSALITAIGMSLCLQTMAHLLWSARYESFPTAATKVFDSALIARSADGLLFRWNPFGPALENVHPVLLWKELVTWVAALVLMIVLLTIVQRTKIGKAMRACALDQQTAWLMGINVNHVIAFTFMIGSAMAAVAGILNSVKVGGNIYPRMGYYPGVIAFAAAVLGGIGNIKGAVLGGLIIGFTEAFGGAVAQEYDKAFAFGLMVIFILFRPWGILGQKEAKRA
jgi:branched-chain amino acid transport system permease protein